MALTNANCNVKPDIVCNRAPPKINFQLIPAIQGAFSDSTAGLSEAELNLILYFAEKTKLKNVVFNCENLNSLEILQEFNKHISSLAPKEDDLSSGPKTKLEKKASKRR